MKNNKGFTIIELMGTLIVLALVSAIVIPSVISIIKRMREDSYKETVSYVIKAAQKWALANSESFSESRNYYLSLDELLAAGFLDSNKLIDPRNSKVQMDGCITIKFNNTYKQYDYDYSDEPCTGVPGGSGSSAESCFTFSAGTITGYTCLDTIISIPSQISGSNVTKIGASAFKNKGLTSVTVPSGVTQILNDAFSNNSITTVSLPNTLTHIGNNAFERNKIASLTIPNSVTFLGADAFNNNRITNLSIGTGLTSISENAFMDNQILSLAIPSNVTTIGVGAFSTNRLTTMDIPATVTTMDCTAFEGNSTLTTIRFLGASTNFTTTSACTNAGGRYSIATMFVPIGSLNNYDNKDGSLNGQLNNWPLSEG